MNVKKLCDRLIEDESIKDIPLTYVFRVVLSVFELINSGEFYFQNNDFD